MLKYSKKCSVKYSVQQHFFPLRGIPAVMFDIPKNIYRPEKIDAGRGKSNSITAKLLSRKFVCTELLCMERMCTNIVINCNMFFFFVFLRYFVGHFEYFAAFQYTYSGFLVEPFWGNTGIIYPER